MHREPHRKDHGMNTGMVGLGRMGANMTLRLLRARHKVVAFDQAPAAIAAVSAEGATAAATLEALVQGLEPPRVVWAMIPAGRPVDALIDPLPLLLAPGDLFVDGCNSHYHHSP